jgi:flagellar biosynthesis GTPase FlhF
MAPSQAPVAARSSRRRQRSTRLTVAVALLVVAALVVAGALASGSLVVVSLAALVAVVLGAAATKITHSELLDTRREAARDRAEQAQAYRRLTEKRTLENKAFAETMRARITGHESSIAELQEALTTAQRRAAEMTRKMNTEARRADVAEREGRETAEELRRRLAAAEQHAADAVVRVAELEHELDVVRAELEVVTQAWREAEAGQRRHA